MPKSLLLYTCAQKASNGAQVLVLCPSKSGTIVPAFCAQILKRHLSRLVLFCMHPYRHIISLCNVVIIFIETLTMACVNVHQNYTHMHTARHSHSQIWVQQCRTVKPVVLLGWPKRRALCHLNGWGVGLRCASGCYGKALGRPPLRTTQRTPFEAAQSRISLFLE